MQDDAQSVTPSQFDREHGLPQGQAFRVERAVAFEDGRSHFLFSDNTSLILHPGATCFTYFGKAGRKLR